MGEINDVEIIIDPSGGMEIDINLALGPSCEDADARLRAVLELFGVIINEAQELPRGSYGISEATPRQRLRE